MAVRLNGTTGYLTVSSRIVSAQPFFFAFWHNERSDTGLVQFLVAQSQASSDKYAAVSRAQNGNVQASYAWTGNGTGATKTGPTVNTTYRACVASFKAGTNGQSIWYGDTTEGINTNTTTDQTLNHDTFSIGALLINGAAALGLSSADVAEVHIYTGTPTDAFYTAFVASTSPETLTTDGVTWVDGFKLESTSDLTSIGGTRTLTLVGGATSSAHPFARTPAGPTINTQPSNISVTSPATANFTVATTTSGGTLTYRWQRSTDSGATWANTTTGTGGTTASYTTAATTVSGGDANNGNRYRCNVTDTNGTTSSAAAILTVNAAPTTMTIALKQTDGVTAAASITGIEVAVLNASTLGSATAVVTTYTGESTDASGNLVIDLAGLGIAAGQVRYVIAGKSNGTVGANFDGWHGPAVAA